jgi:hypothetical protein
MLWEYGDLLEKLGILYLLYWFTSFTNTSKLWEYGDLLEKLGLLHKYAVGVRCGSTLWDYAVGVRCASGGAHRLPLGFSLLALLELLELLSLPVTRS